MKNLSIILILFFISGCVTSTPSLPNDPETLKDLKVYNSKKELAAFRYAWEELPQERQVKLAYHLLESSNGITVYRGAQLLIKNGKEEPCFDALAKLIADGKDMTDLKGRMGYDWIHSDDRNLFPRMMMGILTSLNSNYSSYSSEQKQRVLLFFKKLGYTGDYNKQKVQQFVDAKLNEIKNNIKTP